jgi:hypothetical protein
MSSVLLLSALALGAATAAPDQQEEGRERHGAGQEYKDPPHAVGAYHWNGGGRIPTIAYLWEASEERTSENSVTAKFAEFLFHALR